MKKQMMFIGLFLVGLILLAPFGKNSGAKINPSVTGEEGPHLKLTSRYFEYVAGPGAAGIFVEEDWAYVTTAEGVRMYDVSDKQSPELVSTYPLADASNINIVNPYAYVSRGKMDEETGYLTILDVSNSPHLQQVGEVELPHGTIGVEVRDDFAYLGGYDAGLFLVDISDKSHPVLVNTVTFPRVDNPKAEVRQLCALASPERQNKFPCKVGRTWWSHIDGNHIYVNDENTGLYILDLSNPANPVEISNLIYPLRPGTDNLADGAFNDIYVEGEVGYIALDDRGLLFVDLSDKGDPSPIYHYDPWESYAWYNSPGHVVQVVARDNIVYATAGEAGLFGFEAGESGQPELIVEYALPDDVGTSWGLFLDKDYLYVTYLAVDPGLPAPLKQGGWEILSVERSSVYLPAVIVTR